jgi:protein TonB
MELKKSNKANLDKQRALFFEIGLLVALGIVFAAFEWGTEYNSNIEIKGGKQEITEWILPPVTHPEPEKKAPPKVIADVLNLVDIDMPGMEDPIFIDPADHVWFPPIDNPYQTPPEEPTDLIAKEYEVDIQAQFLDGGTDKFLKWVMAHIEYPEVARINNIEGKIIVSFVIDKKGNLTNIKFLREIDQSLVEETTRVLNLSPTWKPAIKKGKVIAVEYQMPVKFALNQQPY